MRFLPFEPMFRMLNRRGSPPGRPLVSHEIPSDGISVDRTYVPFAQWSFKPLGAGFVLPFALTNSGRFLLRRTAHWADASFVCPHVVGPRSHRFFLFHQCKRAFPFGRPFALVGLVGLEPMTPTMSKNTGQANGQPNKKRKK